MNLKTEVAELKEKLVDKEAKDLQAEFNEIFSEDISAAEKKLIEVTNALEAEGGVLLKEAMLNRYKLYEVLLDNSTEDIVKYFQNQGEE